MGTKNQVAQSPLVECGACKDENHADARFCKGCGQTLHEPCVGCGKPVLLTQKFCGTCGTDLETVLRERHQQFESWLAKAVDCAKEHEFQRAVGLLNRVAEVTDYRFKELSQNATQAVAKVRHLQSRAEQARDEAINKALVANDQDDKATVIQQLESIPSGMITEDANKLLSAAKAYVNEKAALECEVRNGISAKDWPLVGGLLDQLVELAPDETQYLRLAKQIGEKLISSAQRDIGKGNYSRALSKLNAVPTVAQSDQHEAILTTVGDAYWLAEQFSLEPFATPMLGRLAVRFSKAASNDLQAKKVVTGIASCLKQGERDLRSQLPRWQGTTKSWMGGDVAMLGKPQAIDTRGQELLSGQAGRFTIAYGLALQGLGRGRVTEHFGPKKGLLGSLRKKCSRCWGLDVGSATVKAVLLEEIDGQVNAVDCFFEELPTPLCRMTEQQDVAFEKINSIVGRFLATKDVEGTPVWINLAEGQTVNRFVRLPPVKDKQAQTLLDREIEQKIPIPADELSVTRWISDAEEGSVHGRSALITVVRRKIVEGRIQMFADAGLTVAGVQSNAVALVNFAANEFEELAPGGTETQSEEDTPTIAFLDCGASGTTLTLVSREAHWSWTLDCGGEDLTGMIARATKVTRADAEKLKRNPSKITSPSKQYELAEQQLSQLRSRLETALADAIKQNKRFRVKSTWCVGGGCLAHGWIRHVALDSQ